MQYLRRAAGQPQARVTPAAMPLLWVFVAILILLVLVTVVTRMVLFLLDFLTHYLELLWARILRFVDGVTPANVQVPDEAMNPGSMPAFPGFFPTP